MDLGGIDPYVYAAIGIAVVFAAVWALVRGGRGDAMVELARWCEGRGLAYVPSADPAVVGRFEGAVDGRSVTIDVVRIARRALTDLPPVMTRISCRAETARGPVLIQPAAWAMTVEGDDLPPRVATGSHAFRERWAVYAADAAAGERLVVESVQRRLMEDDAEGLGLFVGNGQVMTAQPGIVAGAREGDRRVAVVCGLSRLIDP